MVIDFLQCSFGEVSMFHEEREGGRKKFQRVFMMEVVEEKEEGETLENHGTNRTGGNPDWMEICRGCEVLSFPVDRQG